jgi:hypothetical protein
MQVGQIKIPIALWQIEEILQKRVEVQKHKIDDLFCCMPSGDAVPDPGFYDTQIETKYGKIRFFFVQECPTGKFYIFHRLKFDFPKPKDSSIFDEHGNIRNAAERKSPIILP